MKNPIALTPGGKSRDYFDGGLTKPVSSLEQQAEKARTQAGKNKSNDQHKIGRTPVRHGPSGKFR
jgi:hypothetical protein